MKLPADLPRRPAAEAARVVALALLDGVEREAARLGDAEDEEGLHDFRVALRRLRSTLGTWRRELEESVRKRDRRALRELQEATGGGRDAEVALAWIAQRRDELGVGDTPGLERISARLEGRLAALHGRGAGELRGQLERTAARLRARLSRRVVVLHVDRPLEEPGWAQALARAAERQVDTLAAGLATVHGENDRTQLHAARIEGKRLRYLLEPARAWSKAAVALVGRLKDLQDVLGDMQDAHVLTDELEAERHSADEGARVGLEALAQLNGARLSALFERLRSDWLPEGLEALRRDVGLFGVSFTALGRGDVERERKYLLARMPELPAGAEVIEVEQGWLPGVKLRERLRRVSGPSGERLERALKLGAGVERIEIEEPLSARLFAALWPLTEGCRVRKRRHRVRVGAYLWEVDEFVDRPLVLAEVELERADARPALPDWLAPHVVREVTDEPAFTNLALGEAGPAAVPH